MSNSLPATRTRHHPPTPLPRAGLYRVMMRLRERRCGMLDRPSSVDRTVPRPARRPAVAPPLPRGPGWGGAWRAGAGPAAGAQLPATGRTGPGAGVGPGGRHGLLSALSLGELALSFSRVPLFPVFDLSYFIVSILYLKYEPGEPARWC